MRNRESAQARIHGLKKEPRPGEAKILKVPFNRNAFPPRPFKDVGRIRVLVGISDGPMRVNAMRGIADS